jgi:hypothetical protein
VAVSAAATAERAAATVGTARWVAAAVAVGRVAMGARVVGWVCPAVVWEVGAAWVVTAAAAAARAMARLG